MTTKAIMKKPRKKTMLKFLWWLEERLLLLLEVLLGFFLETSKAPNPHELNIFNKIFYAWAETYELKFPLEYVKKYQMLYFFDTDKHSLFEKLAQSSDDIQIDLNVVFKSPQHKPEAKVTLSDWKAQSEWTPRQKAKCWLALGQDNRAKDVLFKLLGNEEKAENLLNKIRTDTVDFFCEPN